MKELAKSLAFNHYNLSLSTINGDYKKSQESTAFNQVFVDEMSDLKNTGFARNILIIGAGASKNAYKEFHTADAIANHVYKELGLFEIFLSDDERKSMHRLKGKETNNVYIKIKDKKLSEAVSNKNSLRFQAKKFVSDSFVYIKRVQDLTWTIGELIQAIGFEGGMKVLTGFINKKDISEALISILDYRYIPNLFYELVAHMLKHRFIDVIINLNFDEMLDNALEDEMGESSWIKIINDASCIQLNDAMVEGRLRKPLYIKPHGTVSDIDSLVYSVSQYINLSPPIKQVLQQVLTGYNGENSQEPIKNFNIITAGYSFNDEDIVGLLNQNISRNYTEDSQFNTRLYVMDPKISKVLDTLSKKIQVFYPESKFDIQSNASQNSNTQSFIDEVNHYISDVDRMTRIESHSSNDSKSESFFKRAYKFDLDNILPSEYEHRILKLIPLSYAENNERNLNNIWLRLFSDIQRYFSPKFAPSGPGRHLFNCQIFTKTYINSLFVSVGSDKLELQFLKHRYIANLMFDFLKFNGRIPLRVITNGRAGKYYKLYAQKSRERDEEFAHIFQPVLDLFDFPETIYNKHYLVDQRLYDLCYASKNGQNDTSFFKEVSDKLLSIVSNINSQFAGQLLSSIFHNEVYKDYLYKIAFSGSHEINPKYWNSDYFRFYPFESGNIITTNLALRWYFFDFAVNQIDSWDELDILSNNGNVLKLLYMYEDHLATIFQRNKRIKLLHYSSQPTFFKKADNNFNNPKSLIHFISDTYPEDTDNFSSHQVTEENVFHKIVIFRLKNEPVFGIYFASTFDSNRINPVIFRPSDKNGLKNLRLIDEILQEFKAQNIAPTSTGA